MIKRILKTFKKRHDKTRTSENAKGTKKNGKGIMRSKVYYDSLLPENIYSELQ